MLRKENFTLKEEMWIYLGVKKLNIEADFVNEGKVDVRGGG